MISVVKQDELFVDESFQIESVFVFFNIYSEDILH